MNLRGLPGIVLFIVLLAATVRAAEKKKWTFGALLKNCSPNAPGASDDSKDFVDILRRCVQRRALIAMDALLGDDVITVVEGVELVRYKNPSSNATNGRRADDKGSMDGRESGKSWIATVFARLSRVFRTHVLKIDVDQLSRIGGASDETDTVRGRGSDAIEGRRRRRGKHMMPMLMMGILIMGSVLIPMGFQFLAVLGGKALILAKLALMLSSIQGLKKIATNGVNYGLYHQPEPWHERSGHEPTDARYEMPYQYYPMPPRV